MAFEDTVMSPSTIWHRLTDMSVFVVVTEAGDIRGTIGCKAVGDGGGHIRGMAVHPACAGTGLARLLLEAVEAELGQRGCIRVTLDTTRPLERASRFYVRNGFQPTVSFGTSLECRSTSTQRTFGTAVSDSRRHSRVQSL